MQGTDTYFYYCRYLYYYRNIYDYVMLKYIFEPAINETLASYYFIVLKVT